LPKPKPNPLFDKLTQLDRLEELREELLELGVTTLAELEARIAALEAEIGDEPERDDSADGPL
jgi:uncharacterized small protein (DUF1192 family)